MELPCWRSKEWFLEPSLRMGLVGWQHLLGWFADGVLPGIFAGWSIIIRPVINEKIKLEVITKLYKLMSDVLSEASWGVSLRLLAPCSRGGHPDPGPHTAPHWACVVSNSPVLCASAPPHSLSDNYQARSRGSSSRDSVHHPARLWRTPPWHPGSTHWTIC